MAFSGDPVAESMALLASSLERIRVTWEFCEAMRRCCEETSAKVRESHATLLRCDEALDTYGALRAPPDDGTGWAGEMVSPVDEATT